MSLSAGLSLYRKFFPSNTTITPPSVQEPHITPAFRDDLDYSLSIIPADILRCILKQKCDSDSDFAAKMHQILCIDQVPTSYGDKVATKVDDPGTASATTTTGQQSEMIVDLTDPEADKENAQVPLIDQVKDILAGKKRNADRAGLRDPDTEQILKKLKASVVNHENLDQQLAPLRPNKRCANCYALFDTEAERCHEHKDGPVRVPGPRDRVEDYASAPDGDTSEEGDSDSSQDELDYCECVYHSGTLTAIDEEDEFWDEFETEEYHWNIEADDLKQRYPDMYYWDCCNQNGEAEGCKMDKHNPGLTLSTYAKMAKSREKSRSIVLGGRATGLLGV